MQKLLIADDDADNVEFFRASFADIPVEMLVANDVNAAMRTVRDRAELLLGFVSYDMAECGGADIVRAWRAVEKDESRKSAYIAVHGNWMIPAYEREAEEAGTDYSFQVSKSRRGAYVVRYIAAHMREYLESVGEETWPPVAP